MQYKKITLANWKQSLAELRSDSKRSFGAKLEANRVSFDLSVLRKAPSLHKNEAKNG